MTDSVRSLAPGDWYADVPRSITRQIVFGLSLMVFAFGGFGVWAFRAPLAAAVIAQGSFVATGQNKIVQHLEGGIIKTILVQEGDVVSAGQTLLRLDETAAQATERELFLRRLRLEATEARLLAEHHGRQRLVYPPALLENHDDPEVLSILQSQKLAFEVASSRLGNDVALLSRNIEALEIRIRGYELQLGTHQRQIALLTEEHEAKQDLFEAGLVRKPEVSALRRTILEAEGQAARLEAEIFEFEKMLDKYRTQIEKTRDEHSQAALDELQAVQSELESIREKSRQAQNVLRRADVLAPVSGTVVRLHYHTAGGVVETGKPIMEILPADAPLIIEVLVPRTEIDSVRTGQPATVRLTALNQRTTPVLEGRVSYVSADAVADTVDGTVREVYVARISLAPEELGRIPGFAPTPGMPAQIMIQTAERTFAQYLVKPIADSMSRAFREQ